MPRRSARKTSAVIGKKDENGNPGGDRCDTVPSAAFPLAPSGVALETSIEGNQDGTSAPGGDKRPGERRKSSTIERTEDADDGDHSTSNDRKVATVDGLASAARKRARLEIPQSSGEAQVTSSRKDDSPQKAERRSATTPRSSRLVDAQRTVGTEKMHPHAGDGDLGTKTPGSASRKPHSVDPPRRVQKNPQFLQEHRERYEAGSKHRRKFLDGNYDTYYSYRNPGAADDPRLQVMDSSWFEGKRALDIGCNSGAVTIEIAERFRPKHIMGLDIDPSLIAKARANVICKACRHQPKPGGQSMAGGVQGDMRLEHQALLSENGEPLSVSAHNGTERRLGRLDLDLSLLPDSDAEPFAFPYNCSFRREDYCEDPCIDARYDAVLCLSVTKWVHYNRGDEGVKKLFSKVYRSLREGGRFILEWQEWSSYKKKKTLTPLFKANCAAIRLHPGSFRDYLVAEVGFKSAIVLNPPKGNSEGFQRPLVVFEK